MTDVQFKLTANKSSCTCASKPLPGKSAWLPTCRFLHYQTSYPTWPLLIYTGRLSGEWKDKGAYQPWSPLVRWRHFMKESVSFLS